MDQGKKILFLGLAGYLLFSLVSCFFSGGEDGTSGSAGSAASEKEKTWSEMSKEEQGKVMSEAVGGLLQDVVGSATDSKVGGKMLRDMKIIGDPDKFMKNPENMFKKTDPKKENSRR